eukprot:1393645-Amorphochlora_amoeboformis.AAC.4
MRSEICWGGRGTVAVWPKNEAENPFSGRILRILDMNSMLTLIKKNPKLALGVVLPLILVALRRVINSLRALARQKELKELADEKRRHRDAILEAMDLPGTRRNKHVHLDLFLEKKFSNP